MLNWLEEFCLFSKGDKFKKEFGGKNGNDMFLWQTSSFSKTSYTIDFLKFDYRKADGFAKNENLGVSY